MITEELNILISKFNALELIQNSFKNILTNNTCVELDIDSKNISIDLQGITYTRAELDYHKFQTTIVNNQNKTIGYYAIVITNCNEMIDDYFVITN